jgi:hypothetical protein
MRSCHGLHGFARHPETGVCPIPWELDSCGKLPGGALLAAVIDLCYDELTDIQLFCAKKPRKTEVLTPAGKWQTCEFEFQGNTLELKKLKCGAYQPLILKIS